MSIPTIMEEKWTVGIGRRKPIGTLEIEENQLHKDAMETDDPWGTRYRSSRSSTLCKWETKNISSYKINMQENSNLDERTSPREDRDRSSKIFSKIRGEFKKEDRKGKDPYTRGERAPDT